MSVFYTKLIDFTLCNDDTTDEVLHKISIAWELPNKYNQFQFKSKVHPFIIMSTLQETLLYSFQTYLQLKPIKSDPKKHIQQNHIYETDSSDKSILSIESETISSIHSSMTNTNTNTQWIRNIYQYLIHSLTLKQKAYLFSISSDRRTRRYHIVHEYKDCIIGYQGVNWMLTHLMATTRLEAVQLGKQFIDNGFLYHVCKEHTFKDAEFWYYFNDELIQAHKLPMVDSNYSMRKFKKHSEIIQGLISLTIAPDTEIAIISDVEKVFALPQKTNIKKQMFSAKYIDNVCFNTILEVVQFMLIELWDTQETQNIYNKLIGFLTEVQKAYLFSIGIDTKDRKYHLKTYHKCFVGQEAVTWFKKAKFVETDKEAIELGNKFLEKNYFKHWYKQHEFKNEFLFYVFNDNVINKAITMERYTKQKLLHQQKVMLKDCSSITDTQIEMSVQQTQNLQLPMVNVTQSIFDNNSNEFNHKINVSNTICDTPYDGKNKESMNGFDDLAIYQSMVYGNNQLMLQCNQSLTNYGTVFINY